MGDPIAPSSVYRANGRPHPVYWYGRVLWLTPAEYAAVRKMDTDASYPDATDEQIEAHDEWYSRAAAVANREADRFAALFNGGHT